MQESPTTLVIPGGPAAKDAAGTLIDPAAQDLFARLVADAGTLLIWAAPVAVVLAGLWVATNGRRRRRIDPRELAFRRVARAQGWSRTQVRALRRAASSSGLASPVGLALSPSLTASVLAGGGARPGRRAG